MSERRIIQDPPHTTGLDGNRATPHPSQTDSVTRRVQNLHISDSLAVPAALLAPPPSTLENSRRPPRRKQQPKECGPDPAARKASSDHGPCSTRGKSTWDSKTSQKALGNCAVLTVQPASFVALSDHNDATDAAFATAIPLSVNFVSGILFRTDDSPHIRAQRPVVRPPINNLLRAHRRAPR